MVQNQQLIIIKLPIFMKKEGSKCKVTFIHYVFTLNPLPHKASEDISLSMLLSIVPDVAKQNLSFATSGAENSKFFLFFEKIEMPMITDDTVSK